MFLPKFEYECAEPFYVAMTHHANLEKAAPGLQKPSHAESIIIKGLGSICNFGEKFLGLFVLLEMALLCRSVREQTHQS